MFAKVFLLGLLVVASNAATVSSTLGYKDAIDMFLAAWKNMIPCGSGDIPPMAPLTVDFYPFNYSNGETNIVGNVSNIRITGLDNFEILSGSYDNATQHATFDVMFPALQIVGSYIIEGTFGFGGLPLPIVQNVLINKKIMDWRFVGEYTFAQTNSNGLTISDFDLHYYVSGVKAGNWNKYMDVATNNFMNNFIESFSMLFTEEVQPYVHQVVDTYMMPSINELLSTRNMNQLIEYLATQAWVWNMSGCNAQA